MKYVSIFLLAFLISGFSFSQKKGKDFLLVDSLNYDSLSAFDKHSLDSLLPLYHQAKHDSVRIKILAAIPELTNDENVWPKYNRLLFEKAKKNLADSAALNSKEIKLYKKFLGLAYQNLGYEAHFLRGQIKESENLSRTGLAFQLAADDKKGAAVTLQNIGLLYTEKGDIPTSLAYYLKALKMQEELHDTLGMGYALNNISFDYMAQGDTAKAYEFAKKSLKCREKSGDKRGYVISLGSLGNIYRRTNKIDSAISIYKKILSVWIELGEKQGIGYAYMNIGNMFHILAKNSTSKNSDSLYLLAYANMKKAISFYQECNYKQGLSQAQVTLGNIFLDQNKIPQAEEAGRKAYTAANEIGYVEVIRNASNLLYEVYRKQNKWKDALEMHEIYLRMRDSIFNQETQKATFKQQTKYEYEKKQALTDAEHQKELAIADEEKKQQKIISYSIGAGLLLVVLFSIFILNRWRIVRQQKMVIEQQKKIVEQKNKNITDSINYAKRIQDSILPSKEELTKYFPEHFVFFRPREIVSGDFYWLSSQNEKTILAIADCTGHGVPGAFMSMIGNTLLNEIVNEQKIFSPAEILNRLNEGIVHALHGQSRSQDDGMDISVCLFEKNKIKFAGANHSLYIVQNNSLQEIKGDIYSIGSMFGPKDSSLRKKDFSFSEKEFSISGKTSVYMTTDGFADQVGGASRKKFMTKQMFELFISISGFSSREQEERIKKSFNEWKGENAQLDDVLVAGIKLL